MSTQSSDLNLMSFFSSRQFHISHINLTRLPAWTCNLTVSSRVRENTFHVETTVTGGTHWFIPASICVSKEISPLAASPFNDLFADEVSR